jgi:hypothetical protein
LLLEAANSLPLLPIGSAHVKMSDGSLNDAPHELLREVRRRDTEAEIVNKRFTKFESRAFRALDAIVVANED